MARYGILVEEERFREQTPASFVLQNQEATGKAPHGDAANLINEEKALGRIRDRAALILRAAVSIGLIAFLIHRAGANVLLQTLISVDAGLFLLACFIGLSKHFLDALRLYLLLLAKNIRVPFSVVTKITFTCTFLGSFTPTSLGPDILRAYGCSKYTDATVDSISAIVINRFIGIISLISLALICACLGKSYIDDIGTFWLLFLLSIPVLLVALGFSRSVRTGMQHIFPVQVDFISRLTGWIADIGRSFYQYKQHGGTLLLVFAVSFAFQGTRIGACYILARALDVHVHFEFFFIFIPLVLIITMLPFSIGGIGMREGGVVYFLGKAGVTSATSLGVSILWFVSTSLPGLYFYLREGVHPRKE